VIAGEAEEAGALLMFLAGGIAFDRIRFGTRVDISVRCDAIEPA
jgi:hypothetical protein